VLTAARRNVIMRPMDHHRWPTRCQPVGCLLAVVVLLLSACGTVPSTPSAERGTAPSAGGVAAQPAERMPTAPAAQSSDAQAASSPTLPAAPERLIYAHGSAGAPDWPIYVAEARGYFAEQALAVELIATGGATVTMQGIASGAFDIVQTSPDPPIRAAAAGLDLVILSTTQHAPIYGLYGERDVARPEQLRARTVIVGGPKDITRYIVDRMLAPNGLRDGDYSLAYAGGTPDRLRALQSGAVQAAILNQPSEFVARREGFPLLVDSYDYIRSLPFGAHSVARAWLGEEVNRQRVVRFLAAAYRGAQDVCDPTQKEAMIRILANRTELTDDDARETYALLVEAKRSANCELRVAPEALQVYVDYIVAMGDLDPPGPDVRRIADPSYLDQATARLRR
jgi:ABC-type nitrate/sulfonate/bicarbonate transport system substrate-binding protein